MNRENFVAFVEKTIEEVIELAEEKAHRKLTRKLAFQWLGKGKPRITENIVDQIVDRIFVDEEHIYPCVDIGVGDVYDDGTLLIVGSVAGYAPRPFGENWTGREGPFVHIVGHPFLARMVGKQTNWSTEECIFGYNTPDVKNLPRPPGR
jgi:hypothetical protein